jgi:hypothetical protein
LNSAYQKLAALSVAVLLSVALAGCGDGRPKRVPVAGQVLIDDKPLTYGQIMFVPESGRQSQGEIGSDGHFKLSCYEANDGALVGTHKIGISAGKGISNTQTRWYAPKKFADYRTSGLTETIDGPKDNLVIKISWEGGKEFVETEAGTGDNEGFQGNRGKKKQPE